MQSKFNIRVYGICIQEGRLLVNEEIIRGKTIIKLPGGGMELGEGTIDCLKREWKEELNIDIEVKDHFYTTDFFQPSAYDQSQVISIYYYVTANIPEIPVNSEANERTYWMDVAQVSEATFTLPIDKIVGQMLHGRYGK